MAFLIRPATDKPIPAKAVRCRINGNDCVRWSKRGGGTVTGLVLPNGKCRVQSPTWWVEYRDSNGLRQRVKVGRDKAAAEHRMAQIVQDVERQKGGLLPRAALPTGETLTALADEYRRFLEDMGRTDKHAAETRQRIAVVLAECRWVTVADVTVARWVRWVGESRKDGGFAADTVNHYLRSLRAFFRWMIDHRGLAADPLAAAKLLNADADRRIRRRALSAAEFRRLIDATRASDRRRLGLDGPARAALYLIAARTGLRAGVLARLTPDDLRLSDPTPHVRVEARRQKARKEMRVPVPRAVLAELQPWLDARPPGPLWPGNWHAHHRGAKILRLDLAAAGVPVETPDGGYDFHALRKQCGTDLARAGVPLTTTQAYLGHSTPALTAKLYIATGLAELGAAADQLGSGLGSQAGAECSKPGSAAGKRAGRKG